MLKKNRSILGILLAIIIIFTFMLFGHSRGVKAEVSTPSVSIYAKNLSFTDTIYVKYAVKTQNVLDSDKVGLLVWTEAPESYIYGKHKVELEPKYESVNGTVMPTFTYKNLAARQMTDNLYAVAYVKRDGEYIYSAPKKYSVLEYAYNKLGKTNAKPTTNNKLMNLLDSMLIYGGAAQTYFDYQLDRLASEEHYYIDVENGSMADGFNYGLFTKKQKAVVEADERTGANFVCWKDSSGKILSTNKVYEHTPSAKTTLIAVYDDEFELNNLLSFNFNKTSENTTATLSLSGNVKVCGFEAIIKFTTLGAEYLETAPLEINGVDAVEYAKLDDGSIKVFFYQSQIMDLTEGFDIVKISFNNLEEIVKIDLTIDVSVFVDSAFKTQEFNVINTTFEG